MSIENDKLNDPFSRQGINARTESSFGFKCARPEKLSIALVYLRSFLYIGKTEAFYGPAVVGSVAV